MEIKGKKRGDKEGGEEEEEQKKRKSKYRMKQVILWNAAKRLPSACLSTTKFRRFCNIADAVLYFVMSQAAQSECS